MTESTRKILKLDWKTPGIFTPKVGTLFDTIAAVDTADFLLF